MFRTFAHAAEVTKSDTTLLQGPCLWVGGVGDVTIIPLSDYDPEDPTGNSVTLDSVPAGTLLPVRVAKVLAATTATLIVALW